MKTNSKQILISIALIIFGFGLVFVLSNFTEKSRPLLPETYEDEDLALQGAKIKGYSLGFEGLMADWYWMQSLQYIGNKVLKSDQQSINLEDLRSFNPRLLYPLLDTATTLDPQFMAVYSYGAVVLPAIDPNQAIKIAEKGIANNPNEWMLYHQLGYIYWRFKNYEKASEVYSNGAKINGAPPFMQMMTALMKTKGGNRDTARAMYKQMFNDGQDRQTKENAALRLLELDSLDERDAINQVLRTFKETNNRCAINWSEIFPILKSVKLPGGKDFRIDKSNNLIDPSGAPYILDPNNCSVGLDKKTTKLPLN